MNKNQIKVRERGKMPILNFLLNLKLQRTNRLIFSPFMFFFRKKQAVGIRYLDQSIHLGKQTPLQIIETHSLLLMKSKMSCSNFSSMIRSLKARTEKYEASEELWKLENRSFLKTECIRPTTVIQTQHITTAPTFLMGLIVQKQFREVSLKNNS